MQHLSAMKGIPWNQHADIYIWTCVLFFSNLQWNERAPEVLTVAGKVSSKAKRDAKQRQKHNPCVITISLDSGIPGLGK